ncbi:hypothetical protein GCM10027271_19520 [Saccharopolyspora gloriosae]|uniref:SH3 domain-containing protein n=1 Tax=Saccharopolyspora gloriosae TaxID=455344 RepID=A0A840N697_9PSEU|nr:hypothetical protein [Saccharopolyspora gloriosae]MBB5067500.1 hypothetical protein [Saccharopolyspora gloriosae]
MTRTTVLRSRLALVCAAVGLVGVLAPAAQATAAPAADPARVVAEAGQTPAATVQAYYDVNLLAAPGASDVVGFVRAGTLLESPNGNVNGAWYPGTTCGDHMDGDTWAEVYVPGTQRFGYAPSYCIM